MRVWCKSTKGKTEYARGKTRRVAPGDPISSPAINYDTKVRSAEGFIILDQ